VIVIGVALILTGSGRYPASAYGARNNMTQNKSDLLTKLLPIAFVATAALWLVVILITDFPAWTLAVYVAVAIPVILRLSRSDKNDQPN
jgi:Flp pilus assembly protein TadB